MCLELGPLTCLAHAPKPFGARARTDLVERVGQHGRVRDWPPVRTYASARPLPSATRCVLVVNPTRERPIA